jgi:hypothetical protein
MACGPQDFALHCRFVLDSRRSEAYISASAAGRCLISVWRVRESFCTALLIVSAAVRQGPDAGLGYRRLLSMGGMLFDIVVLEKGCAGGGSGHWLVG